MIEWIKFSEKLPEVGRRVLLFSDGEIFIGAAWRNVPWKQAESNAYYFFTAGVTGYDLDFECDNFTHWAELPDGPK